MTSRLGGARATTPQGTEPQLPNVACARRNGSGQHLSKKIASMIASVLHDEGIEVSVCDAATVDDLTGYDSVVLGGALYIGRWHRSAQRFVQRHRNVLISRPIWLFFCNLSITPRRTTHSHQYGA